MRSNKAGLADLKKLHQTAQANRLAAAARADKLRSADVPASVSPALTEAAAKLFARATQSTQPIKASGRVIHTRIQTLQPPELLEQKRQRATGSAQQAAAENTMPLRTHTPGCGMEISDTGQDIAWSAPGVGPDTLRRLKQAYWPVGAQLDLHGLNSDQARDALMAFLHTSQAHATRCVRIIHGQGYGSVSGQGVLKSVVVQWLRQIQDIVAFATAPQAHGGRGAMLVLIRLS